MYNIRPNLVIGFHGCDASVRDLLLNDPNYIKISRAPYDWLGHGMYFWENNYERALQWANDKKRRGSIQHPAVVGAILHLGYCCDFLDSKHIQMLTDSYSVMVEWNKMINKELPKNKDMPGDKHYDKIFRELDCEAIEFMHTYIFKKIKVDLKDKGFSDYKIFDSTRGVFTEGGPAFDGAGIYAKSHIQICIRNLNCIKGFFLPRKEIDFFNYLELGHVRI